MTNEIIRPLAKTVALTALALMLGACASGRPSASAPASAPAPAPAGHTAQSVFPGAEWTREDPETLGFSQQGIDRAIAYADRKSVV